jgi:hypothetical protein
LAVVLVVVMELTEELIRLSIVPVKKNCRSNEAAFGVLVMFSEVKHVTHPTTAGEKMGEVDA